MTALSTTQPPSRNIAGILSIEAGMIVFVAQDAMMKGLLGAYPLWMLIFARGVIALLFLGPLIMVLGPPHRLLTPLWRIHMVRALLFAVGFSLFYTAFPFMGLAEVTTIFFSGPLITAALAAIWLREPVGWRRGICLLIGFVGVVIAINPTSDSFQWVAILPLICAFTYAVSQIMARQIGDQDTTLTLGLHTIALSALMILPLGYVTATYLLPGPEFHHLRWEWFWPTPSQLVTLAGLGALGMAGYMLITRAYQLASASLIAPFDFSYLPLAAIVAYALWGEVPATNTIVGMALIVVSGTYLGWREFRLARKGDATPVVSETTFVPGAPPPSDGDNGPAR